MPTYAYACSACGESQELWLTMSQRTDTVACACGQQAEQVINWDGQSFVKGNQRPFKLDNTCVPIGWERGNTDCAKQEARYAKIINHERKLSHAGDKQAIKGGIRKIATVPRELERMRRNQYGKDYWDPCKQSTSEIKEKLKSDGLLFKN